MGKPPKKHHAEFRFRNVVQPIQKNEVAEAARRYRVCSNQLAKWRLEFPCLCYILGRLLDNDSPEDHLFLLPWSIPKESRLDFESARLA